MRTTKEGIDISRWQGKINWEVWTPADSDKTFIIGKATEGKTVKDFEFV